MTEKYTIRSIYHAEGFDPGREKPENLLCEDNQGRFFLSFTDAQSLDLPEDLPPSACREIDLVEALLWASHAAKFSSGGTGGFEVLLDAAAARLKSKPA